MEMAGAMVYLSILTISDSRRKKLPVIWLMIGSICSLGTSVYYLIFGGKSWEELLLGMIPGAVLLFFSFLTDGAGIGDGIVLLQLDLFLFLERTILTFGFSLLAISLFAAILLLSRRGNRHTRIPYIPFLWIGCLITMLFCG